MLNRRRSSSRGRQSVGPSDHSDWLFSWRTSAREKRRTDVLIGRRVSSVGLVCQGNLGPRRCRREPTPQSAFIATSSSASAWCVPGLSMSSSTNTYIFLQKRLKSKNKCSMLL